MANECRRYVRLIYSADRLPIVSDLRILKTLFAPLLKRPKRLELLEPVLICWLSRTIAADGF